MGELLLDFASDYFVVDFNLRIRHERAETIHRDANVRWRFREKVGAGNIGGEPGLLFEDVEIKLLIIDRIQSSGTHRPDRDPVCQSYAETHVPGLADWLALARRISFRELTEVAQAPRS
jgi:hypothetical protein